MTHYRLPFFEALRVALAERGCELEVAYGEGFDAEAGKRDSGDLPWGKRLRTRYFAGGRICWQPFGSLMRRADLVVIAAENKLIYNLWVQWRHRVRVILWGHGANLQGDPTSLRERFKRRVALRADWWFGYTEHSRPLIRATGFPPERITVLNNSVDTNEMRAQSARATPDSLAAMRAQLRLQPGPVGIFVGSLYEEKRIEFLLEAGQRLHDRVPAFQLVIVGSGPQQALVEAFCRDNGAWAHYAGVLKGQAKVNALALSDVLLNPGLVGLGILDSFVVGVPMVTTDCGLHSPEISYLEHGQNGLMTADDMDRFVESVEDLLLRPEERARLAAGCVASAANYTVENMARRFAEGITACLRAPQLR
jgi:L-malate glycosyltransferase